ncbi:MAG: hypothetical protein KKD86_15025, partial [Bacteroidetes bacterium]|nr:hypothetical protein [Bacteroidota bacterium]
RAIDLDYLNPFAFYTSIQHSEQDRDNAMLFFDFKNNSVKGLKIFGMFLIDDMDFGKIGTSWYGNKTLFSLGLYSSLFNAFCPLDFSLQFIRVEPYTFTHRIRGNEYSNLGYNLIEPIIPNSQIFNAAVFYRFSSNLDIVLSYLNIVHGDNEKDPNGNLSVNHGGDILIGHRPFDSINAKFLGGNKHYLSSYNFNLFYQPTLNYRFNFTMNLKYNKSSYEPRNMELQTNFGFDVIL